MKKSLLRARIFFFMRPQEKERATDIISHSNTIDGLLAFRTLAGPLSPLTLFGQTASTRTREASWNERRVAARSCLSFSLCLPLPYFLARDSRAAAFAPGLNRSYTSFLLVQPS